MEASPVNRDAVAEFVAFHEGWLIRQERLLEELVRLAEVDSAGHNGEDRDWIHMDEIGRVLVHFGEYYEAKTRVIERDVFLLFGPQPSIVFRIVNRSVTDHSEELKREVRAEEEVLAAELAWIQSSSAATFLVLELAGRMPGRPVVNGELAAEDAAVERLQSRLEGLVERADALRRKAVVPVVEMLSSAQAVKFLCWLLRFQLFMSARGRR
ncbi:hypothetical protein CRG98_033019 [Punica granatum]|uniref:DOG1 domain-containing protein n=1 Tax=Punica granatum TaxID=22663 RepID=A0A2I0IRQ8_PUNGR|nr:hypothetical protein CRG98_033019 [Punica granatum]